MTQAVGFISPMRRRSMMASGLVGQMQVEREEVALREDAVQVVGPAEKLGLQLIEHPLLDRPHVDGQDPHPERRGAAGQQLAAVAEADDRQAAARRLHAVRGVELAPHERAPALVVAVREHEQEHHGAVGQGDAAQMAWAVAQHHAGVEDPVDLDVVQAVGLRLDEPDAGLRRGLYQLAADVAAQVDDHLHTLELGGGLALGVEHPQLVTAGDGRHDVVGPGRIDPGGMRHEEHVEPTHHRSRGHLLPSKNGLNNDR